MHDPALVVFCGIGTVIVLLPLPLHWRARNSGTLLLIGWLLIGNLMFFIDGIAWWDSYEETSSPVWCDIVSKLFIGLPVGISATSLCITRRLVMIASSTAVTISQRQKRVALAVDIFLGVVLPFIVMALHYIVQAHRYDIVEGYGCQPVVWPGIPALFSVTLWSPLLTIVATGYGLVAIKLFLSRRLQFQTVLRSSRSELDSRHYMRLMALASVDIVIGPPLTLWTLITNIQHRKPYTSWEWVHTDWLRVDVYPASTVLSSGQQTTNILLPRWFCPFLAVIFFFFFGVSTDAVAEYGRWGSYIDSRVPWLRRRQSTQLPFNAPKLGSTIVRPTGMDGNESSAGQDDVSERIYFQDVDRGKSLYAGGMGGVAVSVEREVV